MPPMKAWGGSYDGPEGLKYTFSAYQSDSNNCLPSKEELRKNKKDMNNQLTD
jgi:hypothetical protein